MAIHYQGDLYRGLPKWPACFVIGNSVTERQAAEIILRTDYHVPYCGFGNDKLLVRQINDLFGIPEDPKFPGQEASEDDKDRYRALSRKKWAGMDALNDRLGTLELDYLHNDRVHSSYIGGLNGWCDWDGVIGMDKNIGKWPEIESVAKEWHTIAQAFPFLKLWCQLFDAESCEIHARPVCHYIIQDGDVTVRPSNGVVVRQPEGLDMDLVAETLSDGARSGMNIGILREKVELVYGEVPQWAEADDDD